MVLAICFEHRRLMPVFLCRQFRVSSIMTNVYSAQSVSYESLDGTKSSDTI